MKKYLFSVVLSLVLAISNLNVAFANQLDPENITEFKNELSDTVPNIVEKQLVKNIKDFETIENVEIQNTLSRNTYSSIMTRATNNSNPNSAIYLPETYFGFELSDTADNYDGWYYFEGKNSAKYTIAFSSPSNCDYDAYLYKLNGSSLVLVDYSINSGDASELITHITDDSYYFIRFTPYIAPTTTTTYTFSILESTSFDLYEPNDVYTSAVNFDDNINISANIDNPIDEDWYKLNVTEAKKKQIALSNAPSGNNYAVLLYDSNLQSLGNFYVDGSATREIDLGVGQYYIRLLSMTGSYTDTNYNLNVSNLSSSGTAYKQATVSYSELEPYVEYTITPFIKYEAGGEVYAQLDFGTNSSIQELYWTVEITYDNYSGTADAVWQEYMSYTNNDKICLYEFPYRNISQIGSPLMPNGTVRVKIIVPEPATLYGGTVTTTYK